MRDWKVYQGTSKPHDGVDELPDPPPWRELPGARTTRQAMPFEATPDMVQAVNAALYLRRPLLVEGLPGSGKSSLIQAVAHELKLGAVLRWNITSSTRRIDGLYRYDALGRLQQKQLEGISPQVGEYLWLGPLGTALADADASKPRALLIDEIDKADVDLPNDLLNVLERGEFDIPEIRREHGEESVQVLGDDGGTYEVTGGHVACRMFPFVVMTSNGERDFPPAFLRRCIRLTVQPPSRELLARIVASHLGDAIASSSEQYIESFAARLANRESLATDQLLNAVYLVTRERADEGEERLEFAQRLVQRLDEAL